MQSGRKHLPLFVMSVALLSVAAADDGAVVTVAPPKVEVFSVHDSNRDGYLDRVEYQHFLESLNARRNSGRCRNNKPFRLLGFDDIDRDANGFLSEDEMVSTLNKRLRQHRRYRHHGGR
ncbi:MAG: EF-hand domain-containing protein [Thiothrix sp.]